MSFKNAPDYENPEDSDQDNYYLVEITVSDGYGGRATELCVIRVRDSYESGRSLESGRVEREQFDQIDSVNDDDVNGIAPEHNPLDLNETGRSIEDIVLPESAPVTSLPLLLSAEDALDLLTELIDPTPLVAIDYQNTLMMDEDDPVSLAQQPLEPSMVKVYSITDLPFLDNCNTMLDDTILIVTSELG